MTIAARWTCSVAAARRSAAAVGAHAEPPGIAAQRRQPEADAPGIVLAPGRAVGVPFLRVFRKLPLRLH